MRFRSEWSRKFWPKITLNNSQSIPMTMSQYQTVSQAERDFAKLYKQANKETLFPADDWLSMQTQTLYEVKDIQYPSTRFLGGQLRMNLVSLREQHKMGFSAGANKAKKTVVVAKFTDGKWFKADLPEVLSHSRQDVQNKFGDRPSLFVDFGVFKEVTDFTQMRA